MSGIENIIKKISEDTQQKAGQIIKAAEDKAEADKQKIIEEANREKDRIISDAELAASRLKEQIVTGKNLEVRDLKLAAKQQVIDKVFAESLSRLNNMDVGEFEKFVCDYCAGAEIKNNDQIILPDKYIGIDVKKINPMLTLYTGERSIDGGFILISGGIEQNNTFSALLDYYKSELEPEIIAKLF